MLWFRKQKKNKENIDLSVEEALIHILEEWENGLSISHEEFVRRFDKSKAQIICDKLKNLIGEKINSEYSKEQIRIVLKIILREQKRIEREDLNDFSDVYDDVTSKVDNNIKANFYYDETNNFGKLYFKPDGTCNEDIEKYFVLGGICSEDMHTYEINDLYDALNLETNKPEFKAFDIFGNGSFSDCLSKNHITVLLKWIRDNEFLLHFEAVDHLNIIANDIARLISDTDEENYFFTCSIMEMLKKDRGDIINSLIEYGYPQINNPAGFMDELIKYVEKMKKDEKPSTPIAILSQQVIYDHLIKKIKKAKLSISSSEYGKDNIVDDYLTYYLKKPIIFLESTHTYDKEEKIQKLLKKQGKITIHGNHLNNYHFEDSEKEPLIQVCDVMVSLFAKFLYFLDDFQIGDKTIKTINKLPRIFDTPTKRENFLIFMELLRKSYDKNKKLINLHESHVEDNKYNLFIHINEISDNEVSFTK